MSIDNVNLFFAKDENDKIVIINDVHKEEHEKYSCPICGSEVRSRMGEINSWHFYHVDKSKCSGESRIHWWIKNKLIEEGTEFTIKTDKETIYICKDILVEKSYEINDKVYQPDLTVITECGKTIYFEMEYSNKKRPEDYMSMWIDLNNIVVEVNTKDLIRLAGNELPVFKALFYDSKCREVKKSNTYHNTIGRYKEQLRENEEYEKRKEGLRKLDWLWRDIVKYNQGKVDIAQIFEIINTISDENYREIIVSILKNKRCNNIINDIENLRIKEAEKWIKINKEHAINILEEGIVNEITFNFDRDHIEIYDKIFKAYNINIFYIDNLIATLNITQNLNNINICNLISEKLALVKFENEVIAKRIKNELKLDEEINLILEKYNFLKDNIIVKRNQIKLIGFYKTRDIIFTINYEHIRYTRQYYVEDRNGRSKLVEDCIETYPFDEYDYKKALQYIDGKIIYELNKTKNIDLQEFLNNNLKINYEHKRNINDNILFKISEILKKNKVKNIIYYYYDEKNKYKKYIYFTDYREKKFLICNKDYLDKKDIENIKEDKYKIINIKNLSSTMPIYLLETKLTYKITDDLILEYIHDEHVNTTTKILLSFNKKDAEYISLDRYDFVKATKSLELIQEDIKQLKLDTMLDCESYKILNSKFIYSKEIECKVSKILYPLIYASKKNNKNVLKIKLNIHFTKSDVNDRLEPWIIKDFINNLEVILDENIEIENIK